MSTLFTSTTVFLANYSSGNIKTNNIQPVSACLAFLEMIWHFFTSGLAFFVHLNLATLLCRPFTLHFADQSAVLMYSCLSYGCCMACKTPWVGMACDNPYS